MLCLSITGCGFFIAAFLLGFLLVSHKLWMRLSRTT